MASTNINMLKKTGNNESSDECYTPASAVKPLLEHLDKNLTYYEATSGISSNIVDFMRQEGFKVVSSNGLDFLNDELPDFDVVLTNPPYSKKDKFIEKCYDLKKPFALLLPVSSIQGKKRGAMFNENGVELLVLNGRVDFTGKGAPHFGVAWFCNGILKNNLNFIDN